MGNSASQPVFICHSSQDKEFVRSLASDLEKHSVEVWFDEWEIKVGDSIIQKVSTGIHESSWLAVVLTKNSVSSSWVQKELGSGLTRELEEKRVFVLPLLKEDCTIPMLLRDKKYADFRTNYSKGLYELISVISPNENIKEKAIKKERLHSLLLPAVRAGMPVRENDLRKIQETLKALQEYLGSVDIHFYPVRANDPITELLFNQLFDATEQLCQLAGIKTNWTYFPVKSGDPLKESLFNELLGTVNQIVWRVMRRHNLL